MKKFTFLAIILLSAVCTFAQAGFEWAHAMGKPFYGETNTRLTSDQNGNIIMAGGFVDTAYFESQALVSNGGTDIFVANYDPTGDLQWLISEGGPDYESVQGIAANDQSILMCASFYGTSEIGTETFESMGSQDIILASYDQGGNFSWAQHFGSPKTDYVNAVCSDPEGNIIFTGHYYDSISFGDTSLYALGGSDIFIAKYSSAGNRIWLRQASGSSSDQSHTIACDEDGNIVFSGSYFNDITIGDTTFTTQDPTGVFFAKLNSEGDLIFAVQADGNGLIANSFALFDNSGNIFFAGNFTDQIHFGPYDFDAGAFNIDVFISKYSSVGNLLWADHGHGLSSDQLISVSTGPLNDLYISGHYLDHITFGDLTLEYTLCCGSPEVFLVRYSEDGTASWGDRISGERALVEDICKNASDELFVAGIFQIELTFGSIVLEANEGFMNYLSGVATATMTSLSEEKEIHELSIYPNPAGSYIMLDAEGDYRIFDMSGRLMRSGKVHGGKVDVSSLRTGTYFIEIMDLGDTFASRFLKK
ncbi:MAG: T9SS type A sorting domain-containing protein [Bacteroidales bacterium]|jgi:hypothetical protein|nr:T9SS type A sorting domain-containing protein [Bacteroidales bacterium]